jgi:hypothetical protein
MITKAIMYIDGSDDESDLLVLDAADLDSPDSF